MNIKRILFWAAVAIVSFAVGILLMNFVVMPLIVRHGDIVTVPDVTEIKLSEAEKILKAMKLEPYIELYDFDATVPENYVYKQEPLPGIELKTSRRVKLWISKGQKKILVPYLEGLPLIQAENILQRFGLNVAKIETLLSDSFPPGRVIKTFPEANTPISKQTGIRIIVSKGTKEGGFPMPNLFGRKLEEVKKPLLDMELVIGNIKYVQSEDEQEGEIILQSPQPGVSVSSGDTITLIVTTAVPDSSNSGKTDKQEN